MRSFASPVSPALLTALLSVALAAPQVAHAQTAGTCLTAREFTALSTYALPSVISGTTRACAAALPATSYLSRNGNDLAQRYAAAKSKAWPEAKAAFLKMATSRDQDSAKLLGSLSDDALQQIADAAFAGIVTGEIKPDSCAMIDRVVALLAPLPAENTAELIAVAAGLSSKAGQPRRGGFSICKA